MKDGSRTTLCNLFCRMCNNPLVVPPKLRIARMFNPNLKCFDITERQTPHP